MHSLKWVAISKLIIQLFRWVATFWVIRLLIPEDYAVVAIAEMVGGYLVAFSALGLGAPLVSMKIVNMSLKRQMLTIGILVNLALFAGQFFVAEIIADIYENPAIADVLQISAVVYLFSAFSFIPSAILVRNMKFKYLSIVEMIAGTVASLSTVILATYGAGYWSLIMGYIINELIRGIFLVCSSEMIIKPALPRKRNIPVFFYCLKMSFSELLFHAKDSIDIIMAGLFLNKKMLGLYNVGLQISSIPLRKIAPPLRKVAFPALSQINNQPIKFREYLLKLQRLAFFITIPVFWGISSVSELLVPMALGDNWNDAAPIILMLCLAMPFRFAEEMLHPILKSLQKGNAIILCNLLGFIIFAAAVFWGIQDGISGLMNSWVIGLPVIYLVSAYITCRNTGTNLYSCLSQCVVPLISGMIMLCSVEFAKGFMDDSWWPSIQILVCAISGAISYIAAIYVFKRKLIVELKGLRSAS